MIRIFLLLSCILIITACTRSDRTPTYSRPDSEMVLGIFPKDVFRPRAYRTQIRKNIPADPNESYSQGYQAGCQTMNSAVGEGLYRLRGPKLEPDKLANDSWYLRGYDDGAAGCFYSLDWELH